MSLINAIGAAGFAGLVYMEWMSPWGTFGWNHANSWKKKITMMVLFTFLAFV